jgi:hypothetical protein
MEGTRQILLKRITAWVTNRPVKNDEGNTYWIYGLPGIGKTSLAHSICATLHDQKHLAGAFFCQRDDPNLSEPRNILPTLIYKLAIIFPPFRNVVADRLRKDPNMTPESMKYSLFLELLCNLPRYPEHALVFVIDALDECGDDQSRPGILRVLTHAAIQAPWLKIVITSRPEVDIQHVFQGLGGSSYSLYDLAADQEATIDLRTFARGQFDLLTAKWHLPTRWPGESDFDRVIFRANGLFIFIKTLVLALRQCRDPEESLKAALHDSTAAGLGSLYGLYSSILKARIVNSYVEFRQVVGVLLATASYRPVCEETIAELAGVKPNVVKMWVDDLSSLLYRDEHTNGVVRVRHLSISDYFLSNHCPHEYHVSLAEAHQQLGIACIRTMLGQLQFNMCKLEDSRHANSDVKDLRSRVQENISDPLQYSLLYWSNHICITPDNTDESMWGSLKEFFEGPYPLFWIEGLSVMGMVPVGAPGLRRLMSWLKVSRAPVYHLFTCEDRSHFAIGCRFCAS